MKFNKIAFAVSGALLAVSQGAFALEEFLTAPGTRAVSMGGAFAAVAADSSSIYYNPAGLGFMPDSSSDFTVEFGDVVMSRTIEEIQAQPTTPVDRFTTDQVVKYAGLSVKGFGVAYFRPYDFYTNATVQDDNGNILSTYQVHTQYEELKLGFGGKLGENFTLGGTFDMVSQSTESNCGTCEESNGEIGIGGTIGALARIPLAEKGGSKLQLAAVYRSKAEVDVVLGDFSDLPVRPSTLSLGASLSHPFSLGEWSLFATVSAQQDHMEYDDVYYVLTTEPLAVSYDRTSFGGEFQFISPNNINIFLRAGSYETEADGPELSTGWKPYNAGVNGNSMGIGLLLGHWVLDYGVEKRTILDSGFVDDMEEEETLSTFSISYTF